MTRYWKWILSYLITTALSATVLSALHFSFVALVLISLPFSLAVASVIAFWNKEKK